MSMPEGSEEPRITTKGKNVDTVSPEACLLSFTMNLAAAARRHLLAAQELVGGHRLDVAGYLFGIAAECAIKAMMIDAGLHPRGPEARREDPFYAHFPVLRTMLRDKVSGRRGLTFQQFIENDSFMNNWSTDMRYADAAQIRADWVAAWAEQAKRAVTVIGT